MLGEPLTLEHLAKLVEMSPDYRVLRRLVPSTWPGRYREGMPVAKGVIADTETTGLDTDIDEIIELGLVAFEYYPDTGEVCGVTGQYGGLEEPTRPISPEASEVHGITAAMVAGQRLDDGEILRLLEGCELVIAHNAKFDRQMLERRLPVFSVLPWACSLEEVPWSKEGLGSRKLEHLAMHFGFFHNAHRAVDDCVALLEVLSRPLKSGRSGLGYLFDSAGAETTVIWALDSPFGVKDELKAHGYRWNAFDPPKNGRKGCWASPGFDAAMLPEEAAWLEARYSSPSATVGLELLTAVNRYSARGGIKTCVSLNSLTAVPNAPLTGQ